MRPALVAAIPFLVFLSCGHGLRAAEGDLEVILAADVSRSIDDAEFELQRKGYAAARNPWPEERKTRNGMAATRAGLIGLPSYSTPLRIGCEPAPRKGFAGLCYPARGPVGRSSRLCRNSVRAANSWPDRPSGSSHAPDPPHSGCFKLGPYDLNLERDQS